MSNNLVIFKGRRDGILIMLDKDCGFDTLKDALKKKTSEAAKFFSNASTALMFSGRKLNEREELELIEIFHQTTDLNITYVTSMGNSVEKRSAKKAEQDRLTEVSAFFKEFSAKENVTYFHKGSLRSGQSVSYAGSVVLFGDLNPGAEIIAEGNIIVLGYAKGLVHAGCSGNRDCYVFALNLQPTQLRISDIISVTSADAISKLKFRTEPKPAFAYISGEDVIIELKEKF